MAQFNFGRVGFQAYLAAKQATIDAQAQAQETRLANERLRISQEILDLRLRAESATERANTREEARKALELMLEYGGTPSREQFEAAGLSMFTPTAGSAEVFTPEQARLAAKASGGQFTAGDLEGQPYGLFGKVPIRGRTETDSVLSLSPEDYATKYLDLQAVIDDPKTGTVDRFFAIQIQKSLDEKVPKTHADAIQKELARREILGEMGGQ
jgi:hypothetical protein